ncbi:MAG: hypothetical protein OEY85_01620 [Rhodospirillales bacterium]|nr:hypothetical protein [Rhodospirillales bacterium]
MSRSNETRKLYFLIFGVIFVVLGIAGLFLPFLQGILFLLVGLLLLSAVSPRARMFRMWLGRRFPRVRQKLEDAWKWLRHKYGISRH